MADNGNVVVGKPKVNDAIAVAPLGTALPTDTSTALNAAFKKVGFISDDGLTESEDRSTDTVTAWGGATVATTQSSFEKTFQFTMIEFLNAIAQRLLRGDANVDSTAATNAHGNQLTIRETADLAPRKSMVIDMVSGPVAIRHVIPSGQVTDSDDIQWTDSDPGGLPVTFSAYADQAGVYVYTYTDDGRVLTT
jgi:hypothetical protein